MIPVSRNIRYYDDIRWGSSVRGRQRTVGLSSGRGRHYLANYVATSSENFEIRTALFYGNKQSVTGL